MVVPSNDAFVGNRSPQQFDLFEGETFVDIMELIKGSDVWDAGTEVNDEIPANTAFYGQTVPNTGVTEGGVVDDHPGLLPPGSGGIVDQPQFVNADFSAEDYLIAQLSVRLLYVNAPLYEDNGEDPLDESSIAAGSTIQPNVTIITIIVSVIILTALFM